MSPIGTANRNEMRMNFCAYRSRLIKVTAGSRARFMLRIAPARYVSNSSRSTGASTVVAAPRAARRSRTVTSLASTTSSVSSGSW
jgi:hypothetical protein